METPILDRTESSNMNSPIKVLMTTWFPDGEDGQLRLETADKALTSWVENLKYEGKFQLHIADDGSDPNRLMSLRDRKLRWEPPVIFSHQQRHGVGASLNAGVFQAREEDALLLYLVDDWELLQPLDLTPWAKLLMEDESIGMVRLGPPHPWLTGQIIHHPDCDWYIKLDRHHFVYGHRPALYHRRFFDAYGLFKEGVSAYECERLYNENFCQQSGPDIVLALSHPWRHIESVELAGVMPG